MRIVLSQSYRFTFNKSAIRFITTAGTTQKIKKGRQSTVATMQSHRNFNGIRSSLSHHHLLNKVP